MPPTAFTAGLTPEEKIVYQRERNKIKQQNLRARRAAAKALETNNNNNNNNKSSSSNSSSQGGGGKTTSRTAPSTQAQKAFEQLKQNKKKNDQEEEKVVDSAIVARMAKRLAELGEGEEEIVRLVEGEREGGPSSNGKTKRARMDPTSFSEFIASPSSAGGGSTPASSSSSATSSSSSSKRLTSFSLFAALLNGSLPPPKPLHLLTSNATDSRALPIILHPDFNPSALSSLSPPSSSPPKPPFHLPARELPSYSYASPVDLDIGRYPSMNPLQSVDWKVRLFQLHSAMHRERMDPIGGYLVNVGLQETVAKAQLLILQLLGASSNQKARFDARRVLSVEDQNYLDYAPMDPRMEWFPDPLVRVHTARTASKGGVNLTEMTGMGIETATLYGDSWDFGAWAMDHHTHVPYIPDCSIYPIGFKCQGGGPNSNHPPHSPGELGGGFGQHVGLLGNHLGLKGSTIREIVLGLEIPNSRTREPVFTSVPEGLWEHLPYDEENPMHEIAWRAGGAAEVHAAIIQSWCDEEAAKKREREGVRI